ncbi:hypothetical protein Poli38472_002352 [Pythium oligandrum]|uniref:MPN domain-containing protein n=1 Tax=Pythium oligandrum TaxID=41045 RepID=A0A8K1CH24_PYTOL|nr:hypothetical protein Poli38472_002352 [Pythium oligandrum]|eukprot:TMW63411.1 hypothetical protein Poli38472_002352 [Pythium oligandrum]
MSDRTSQTSSVTSASTSSVVSERLVTRRTHLQQFCLVDPIKPHLRLLSYYQFARQLYRQTETYYRDGAWDNAYVFMAKFIKLCSKVIPLHPDYHKMGHQKEREWVNTKAREALTLFDAILDGMEEEERDYYEYEQDSARSTDTASESEPSTAPPSPVTTLEDRLAALRLKKAANESAPRESRPQPKMSASYTTPSSRMATSPIKPMSKSSAAYPSVGKASWMEAPQTYSKPSVSSRTHRAPISRQKSQEAFELLSSGKNRTLEIPTSIIAQFTNIAAPNTNRYPDGIETCGILAGVLRGTRLVITTLIIPKQEGSSDMCSMKNEEELFDYCFSHDLLTLGWIHTHPRQTCFLSSVDIHTQCGFQSILPEAVAIVIAPTDQQRNVGVFRLTEPHGLQLIQNCNLTGFHTHPERVQIYSDALECVWDAQTAPAVVDMRRV